MSNNPFIDFIKTYRNDPVKFVKEVIGKDPLDYQAELLTAIAKGERRCSVRSGHGTGKSSTASWVMLHHLFTRFPCKVVVTAPTTGQLFDALFAEVKANINNLPEALKALLTVKSDRIELTSAPAEAFISAKVARKETPEALAGVHASGPNSAVLLVADESSAVDEKTFETASGSMSGFNCTTLLLSNPTRSSGFFFDTQTKLADTWWTRRWSCIESPLVSDDFVKEMRERYGEDSNPFRIRVLGEFGLTDEDTIIPHHLAESASRRDIEVSPTARRVWGLDVSRFGSDKSALAKRVGSTITEVKTWRGLDLMQLCGAVKSEYDALSPSDTPDAIFVDAVGLGSGCCDRLSELGLPAIGINVSESPSMKGQYVNLRAELWWKLKTFLENRDCSIPDDEQLISEMVAIKYKFNSSGKAQAESKAEMKKRGLASPDMADAVCLTMSHDNAIAVHGKIQSWNKPIKRNLRGIA